MTFAEYQQKYGQQQENEPTAVANNTTTTTEDTAPVATNDDKEKPVPQNTWNLNGPKGLVAVGTDPRVAQYNTAIQNAKPDDVVKIKGVSARTPANQLERVQTSQANRQATGNDVTGQQAQQPKQYNGTYDSSSVVPMGSYGEAPRIVPREEGVKSPSYYVDSNGVEHWEGRAMNEGEPTTAYSTETLPTQKAPESTSIERPADTWDKDKVAKTMQAINRMGLKGNDYNPIDLGYATQISDPEKWDNLTDAEKRLVSQAVALANKTNAVSVDDIVNGNIGIDKDKAQALKDRMPQSDEEAKIIGNAKPSRTASTAPANNFTGMTIESGKKDGTKTSSDSTGDDGTNGPSLEDFYKSLNADPKLSEEELRRKRRRELAQRAIAGIGDVGAAVANWSGAMNGGSSFDIPEDSTLTKLYGDRWDKWRKDYEERQEKYRNGLQAVRLQDIQQARADRKEALAEKKADDQRKEYESKQEARQREQDRKDDLLELNREKSQVQQQLWAAQTNLANARGTVAEKEAENYEKVLQAKMGLIDAQAAAATARGEAEKQKAALAVKVATAKVKLMGAQQALVNEKRTHPEKFKAGGSRSGHKGLTQEEYDQIFMDLPESERQELLNDFHLDYDELKNGDTRRMVMKHNADNGGSAGGKKHLQGL